MTWPRARRALAPLAVAALLGVAPAAATRAAAAEPQPVTLTNDGTTISATNGTIAVTVDRAQYRLAVWPSGAAPAVRERSPALPDEPQNPQYAAFAPGDGQGHDVAYPGLPTVSTKPLAYLRGGAWQHVTAVRGARLDGPTVRLDVTTTDSAPGTSGGEIALTLRGRALDVDFRPDGAAAGAVAEAFAADPTEHYFGGGQRFLRPELTGQSVPLWISHGVGSSREAFTNEIAVPVLVSTGGWAVAERTGARGELDVAEPARPDAVSYVLETDVVAPPVYVGSPRSRSAPPNGTVWTSSR